MASAKPIRSEYMFDMNPQPYPVAHSLQSDYVLHTGMNRSELEEEKRQLNLRGIPSDYASRQLRDANAPQEFGQDGLNFGLAISGAELKNRLGYLDNIIYRPAIVNGRLFFVAQDDQIKTARSNSQSDEAEAGVETAQDFVSSQISRSFHAPTAFLGLSIPINTLHEFVSVPQFHQILRAHQDDVNRGRVRATTDEVQRLNHGIQQMQFSRPSESTTTAAGFDSSINLSGGQTTFMQTGAPRSRSIYTARSSPSVYTGAQRSSSCNTARSSPSLYTGAERSASCRTAESSHSVTANDRSARTARTSSLHTGVSGSRSRSRSNGSNISLRTGVQASDRCFTARSDPSVFTAAERSASAHTARSGASARTARSNSHASCPTAQAYSVDSFGNVPAHKLTHTPSDIDNRAAAAATSDMRTATEL